MRRLIFLLPLFLLGIFSFAQQKIITGTVTGKTDKAPLTGVSVQTKSKTVQTDASGKFSIEAAAGDDLTFSYVGMKSVSIKIANSTQNFTVEMEEGVKVGEEVVVIGYTTQRKKDLTGAVAVVDLAKGGRKLIPVQLCSGKDAWSLQQRVNAFLI